MAGALAAWPLRLRADRTLSGNQTPSLSARVNRPPLSLLPQLTETNGRPVDSNPSDLDDPGLAQEMLLSSYWPFTEGQPRRLLWAGSHPRAPEIRSDNPYVWPFRIGKLGYC
jgi:hypothetical protein